MACLLGTSDSNRLICVTSPGFSGCRLSNRTFLRRIRRLCRQRNADIDFSNDPLLQGRNFSYIDTQLKRLGSSNFTNIPINAPRCPIHNFLQDGHMAITNPKGRVNYEPNSWEVGRRESSTRGFQSHPAPEEGTKQRSRSEKLDDHYSQARQFFVSQTPVE